MHSPYAKRRSDSRKLSEPSLSDDSLSTRNSQSSKRLKTMATVIPVCSFCLGDITENKRTHSPENMINCWNCGLSGHPSCLKMSQEMLETVQNIVWHCIECKKCSICDENASRPNTNGEDFILCDYCDRGYHMNCIDESFTEIPEGNWSCPICFHAKNNCFDKNIALNNSAKESLLEAFKNDQLTDAEKKYIADSFLGKYEKKVQSKISNFLKKPESNLESDNSSVAIVKMEITERIKTGKLAPAPSRKRQRSIKPANETPRTKSISRKSLSTPKFHQKLSFNTPSTASNKVRKSALSIKTSPSPVKDLDTSENPLMENIDKEERELFELIQKKVQSIYPMPKSERPGEKNVICQERFPPKIQIGHFIITTWYSAPYPSEYARLSLLYICENCLKYMKSREVFTRHVERCTTFFPPGHEIYRHDNVSVFEVDGQSSKVYCQQLCLLAKLFLDHKTLYYDVEPFLFYVVTVYRDEAFHLVGYFSKEKHSSQKYNLSCIMVLPPYQKSYFGRFLIEFSYLLSRIEGNPGSPEKPLSALGRLSYESYWKSKVIEYIFRPNGILTINEICEKTGIDPNDISSTLQSLASSIYLDENERRPCLKFDLTTLEILRDKYAKRSANWITLNPDALRWSPFDQDTSQHTNDESGLFKKDSELSPDNKVEKPGEKELPMEVKEEIPDEPAPEAVLAPQPAPKHKRGRPRKSLKPATPDNKSNSEQSPVKSARCKPSSNDVNSSHNENDSEDDENHKKFDNRTRLRTSLDEQKQTESSQDTCADHNSKNLKGKESIDCTLLSDTSGAHQQQEQPQEGPTPFNNLNDSDTHQIDRDAIEGDETILKPFSSSSPFQENNYPSPNDASEQGNVEAPKEFDNGSKEPESSAKITSPQCLSTSLNDEIDCPQLNDNDSSQTTSSDNHQSEVSSKRGDSICSEAPFLSICESAVEMTIVPEEEEPEKLSINNSVVKSDDRSDLDSQSSASQTNTTSENHTSSNKTIPMNDLDQFNHLNDNDGDSATLAMSDDQSQLRLEPLPSSAVKRASNRPSREWIKEACSRLSAFRKKTRRSLSHSPSRDDYKLINKDEYIRTQSPSSLPDVESSNDNLNAFSHLSPSSIVSTQQTSSEATSSKGSSAYLLPLNDNTVDDNIGQDTTLPPADIGVSMISIRSNDITLTNDDGMPINRPLSNDPKAEEDESVIEDDTLEEDQTDLKNRIYLDTYTSNQTPTMQHTNSTVNECLSSEEPPEVVFSAEEDSNQLNSEPTHTTNPLASLNGMLSRHTYPEKEVTPKELPYNQRYTATVDQHSNKPLQPPVAGYYQTPYTQQSYNSPASYMNYYNSSGYYQNYTPNPYQKAMMKPYESGVYNNPPETSHYPMANNNQPQYMNQNYVPPMTATSEPAYQGNPHQIQRPIQNYSDPGQSLNFKSTSNQPNILPYHNGQQQPPPTMYRNDQY